MSDSNYDVPNYRDTEKLELIPLIDLTEAEWKDYWNPSKYVFYFFDQYN